MPPRSPRPTASISKNVPLDQGGYTMDHTAIKLIEVLTTLQKAGYLTVALVSLEKMSGP